MATKNRQNHWLDNQGDWIPEAYIKPLDKMRDQTVESIHALARKVEDSMLEAKLQMISHLEEFLEQTAADRKVKEDWKGNLTLDSFDGTKRVERRISDLISFSEGLQLAKTVIDEFMSKRMHGADPALAKIVSKAFNLDKKRGKVDTGMLMRLIRIDIDDPLWRKAMGILKDSIQTTATKAYLSISEKVQTEGGEQWRKVCLDFASIGSDSVEA